MIKDNFTRMIIIDKIVDWDTIHINCDLWFDVWKKMKLRLARINCPEKNTPEGKEAKKFLEQYIGKEWVIESLKYDKYGRGLCELYIGWLNISDLLVDLWYAKLRDWKGEKPV